MRALQGGYEAILEILQKITNGEGTPDDSSREDAWRHDQERGPLRPRPDGALTRSSRPQVLLRNEYLEHIKDHRCRATVCKPLIEYRVIKEKCTGCQSCVRVCPTGQ